MTAAPRPALVPSCQKGSNPWLLTPKSLNSPKLQAGAANAVIYSVALPMRLIPGAFHCVRTAPGKFQALGGWRNSILGSMPASWMCPSHLSAKGCFSVDQALLLTTSHGCTLVTALSYLFQSVRQIALRKMMNLRDFFGIGARHSCPLQGGKISLHCIDVCTTISSGHRSKLRVEQREDQELQRLHSGYSLTPELDVSGVGQFDRFVFHVLFPCVHVDRCVGGRIPTHHLRDYVSASLSTCLANTERGAA